VRILHLSTSAIGGAGIVACRIAELQNLDGHEAQVLSLNNLSSEQVVVIKRNTIRKVVARANTFVSLLDTRSNWGQLTPHSISAKIVPKIEEFKPDIIHIHNWFNLFDAKELEGILREYPCVFHIHDARLMTGGCHYTLDCEAHLKGCIKCPATLTKRNAVSHSFQVYGNIFFNSPPYGLIFPSEWLHKKFDKSKVRRSASVVTRIVNPIDMIAINNLEPQKRHGIVCVISDLNAKVKGFDLFLEAIDLLRNSGSRIHVQVVGANPTKQQLEIANRLDVKLLGRLSNFETLRIIGKSELLIVPSYSENSPTVILESQALGTSVLATNIAGCLELVEDGETGFICEATASSIFTGIEKALNSANRDEIELNAKNLAKTRHSSININLYTAYRDVMSSRKAMEKNEG
jgi:glycosyltransferase involved in cell wall biosynthesis